jgi:hypothetical protein
LAENFTLVELTRNQSSKVLEKAVHREVFEEVSGDSLRQLLAAVY